MVKGTKIYSIFKGKCPVCQEGDFFEGSFFKGNPAKECNCCHTKFEKEPGFFQGSYYVTYALGAATIISIMVALLVLYPSAGFDQYLYFVLPGLVIATPFIYPLSKIIWANFFFGYNKDAAEKAKG